MYPVYKMQVSIDGGEEWLDTLHEQSNRPHHYDYLREKFQELVKFACAPIQYRIVKYHILGVLVQVDIGGAK